MPTTTFTLNINPLRLSSAVVQISESGQGEVYNLGVFEESEIVIGGRNLARGEAIRFTATESVLERWIAPEVFSNLEDVARAAVETNGALPKPSSSAPSASK